MISDIVKYGHYEEEFIKNYDSDHSNTDSNYYSDIDSDLDVVFMKTSEESEDNKLEFFLKINSSN